MTTGKYFIVTSPRSGSHYCAESLAQRLQILPLGECLHHMYPNDVYRFNNNILEVHWPRNLKDQTTRRSSNQEIKDRVYNLISTKNDWQGQAHIAHLLPLGGSVLRDIVKNTNAILLYRENVLDTVLSWIIAYETEKWVNTEAQTPNNIVYKRDIHLDKIKFLIKSDIHLKNLKNKYKWSKIFKYEDFTGNPDIDFAEYPKREQINVWNLPVKSNTEKEKRNIVQNITQLLEDINV